MIDIFTIFCSKNFFTTPENNKALAVSKQCCNFKFTGTKIHTHTLKNSIFTFKLVFKKESLRSCFKKGKSILLDYHLLVKALDYHLLVKASSEKKAWYFVNTQDKT